MISGVALPELRSATSTSVLVVAYKYISKEQAVAACEAPVRVPASIKVPLHPWAWTMNSVRSELARYSKEQLFEVSDCYQQFCGHVSEKLMPIVE